MSANLRVDLSSPVPPFEQIRAGIAVLVGRGDLAPGARLPTVRALAADLGVAAGTVARAYRELEAAGVVDSRGRRGTTVRPTPSLPADLPRTTNRPAAGTGGPIPAVPRDVVDAVDLAVSRARTRGISSDELAALVRQAYVDMPSPVPPSGRH